MGNGKSLSRVLSDAQQLNLSIEIIEMASSTRTSKEAAKACGCIPAQIIKSIVLRNNHTSALFLILVSGANNIDLVKTSDVLGINLKMADPADVRARTGFAIGGVSPLGHLAKLETYFDPLLTNYKNIWAAAGEPNTVFKSSPNDLIKSISAKPLPASCFIKIT